MMTTTEYDCKIGEVVRVEWDTETGEVRVLFNILDPTFKSRILHNKDLQDILTIKGKDVMVVASRRDDDEL